MRDRTQPQEDSDSSGFEGPTVGFEADVQLPDFLRELFLGTPQESPTERTARISAAQDILADLQEEAPELAAYIAARYATPGGEGGE